MTKLNLTANGKPQELILAYIQENASEVLAEKINSGTPFEKDGKQLVNHKDLNGFMKYANDEARKLAEKGANSACVEDSVVYGWAIHYFEEESIEGKLYNTDGTEYTPPKSAKTTTKTTTTPTAVKPVEQPKPKERQASLFDMLDVAQAKETIKPTVEVDDEDEELMPEEKRNILEEQDDETSVEEIADKLQKAVDERHGVKQEPKKELPSFYVQYMDMKSMHKDEIVLIRLGDFYEAFGDDAVTLSDELNLTVTGRNVGLENRVPLVGFPYHVADNYIAKIRNNYGVVILENHEAVVTLCKIVKTDEKTIDLETGEIITPCNQQTDLDCEREIAKAFDKDALIKLTDILGNIFTME